MSSQADRAMGRAAAPLPEISPGHVVPQPFAPCAALCGDSEWLLSASVGLVRGGLLTA